MKHHIIKLSLGLIIIVATVSGLVYWQWPELNLQPNSSPGPTSVVDVVTNATSSLLEALPVPSAGPSLAEAAPAITWTPRSLREVVGQGETKTVTASFTPSEDLRNVVVEVVPELQPFVHVSPSSFPSIAKGHASVINVTFSAPSSGPLGAVTGTVKLRSKTGAPIILARPLPVHLVVQQSGIPRLTFAPPLGWAVQSSESLVFVVSPETADRASRPDAAHIEPDVSIERLSNAERLALSDFALELYEGLFQTFRNREDTTVGDRPAIRFSNVGGDVDRAPVLAVLVSLGDGSVLKVSIPGYEAELTRDRLAGFEQILASLTFD